MKESIAEGGGAAFKAGLTVALREAASAVSRPASFHAVDAPSATGRFVGLGSENAAQAERFLPVGDEAGGVASGFFLPPTEPLPSGGFASLSTESAGAHLSAGDPASDTLTLKADAEASTLTRRRHTRPETSSPPPEHRPKTRTDTSGPGRTSADSAGARRTSAVSINLGNLGEVGRVFEPGFSNEAINTSSGRTIHCRVTPGEISIHDVDDTAYHFYAYTTSEKDGSRTLHISVNTRNTKQLNKEFDRHPDFPPTSSLYSAVIETLDAQDPKNPLKSIEGDYPHFTCGGINSNYAGYKTALDSLRQTNGGQITDEIRRQAVMQTHAGKQAYRNGFTQITDLTESAARVTARYIRPDILTPTSTSTDDRTG